MTTRVATRRRHRHHRRAALFTNQARGLALAVSIAGWFGAASPSAAANATTAVSAPDLSASTTAPATLALPAITVWPRGGRHQDPGQPTLRPVRMQPLQTPGGDDHDDHDDHDDDDDDGGHDDGDGDRRDSGGHGGHDGRGAGDGRRGDSDDARTTAAPVCVTAVAVPLAERSH